MDNRSRAQQEMIDTIAAADESQPLTLLAHPRVCEHEDTGQQVGTGEQYQPATHDGGDVPAVLGGTGR